jgi:hypothetical protein
MVIERLGNPEKFLRVSEAVTATPDPPSALGIPSKPADRCARVRLRACANLRPIAALPRKPQRRRAGFRVSV